MSRGGCSRPKSSWNQSCRSRASRGRSGCEHAPGDMRQKSCRNRMKLDDNEQTWSARSLSSSFIRFLKELTSHPN
eukprot:gene17886-biopygen5167